MTVLHYRFFDSASDYGDFAGLSAGIKRDELSFDLSTREEEYSLQYYEAYGKIDFSVITITSGFAFNGQERHGDRFSTGLGDGFFFDIQCLYKF